VRTRGRDVDARPVRRTAFSRRAPVTIAQNAAPVFYILHSLEPDHRVVDVVFHGSVIESDVRIAIAADRPPGGDGQP
jgi:hypothetical protein